MSETKSGGKTVGGSENFAIIPKFLYGSEIFTLRKYRYVCEIFAMCNSGIFFKYIYKIK